MGAIVEAVAAGAIGFLQKETDRERLLSTVRDAVLGGSVSQLKLSDVRLKKYVVPE